ncbi:MAG: DUF6504 family protein [Planctomycetota bacterium]|jgi:hypothetical protein
MAKFIGDEVEVKFEKKPGPPTAFVWRGAQYRIARIRRRWRTLDLRKAWWRRRHRDHYVVETEGGEVFELYFHRGFGRRYWVLYRTLEE